MKLESMSLQRYIDNFFDPEESGSWRYYDRPALTPEQAGEVAQWYPIGIPYAIALYRYADIRRWERAGESHDRPVLVIKHKPYDMLGEGKFS
jgi:hypothetical protein